MTSKITLVAVLMALCMLISALPVNGPAPEVPAPGAGADDTPPPEPTHLPDGKSAAGSAPELRGMAPEQPALAKARKLDTSTLIWPGTPQGPAPLANNQDSVGNDDLNTADTIVLTGGSAAFGGCSLNTQSDQDDYFKIYLNGGATTTDRLELTFMRVPPYNTLYLQAAVHIMDTIMTNAHYEMDYVYNGTFGLSDQDNQTTLRMNAQHSGWYFMRFGAIKNAADPHYTAYYRVTAAVTSISHPAQSFSNETSPDPDLGNTTALTPSNLLTNRRVVQNFDHWDWYNVSVPNPDHKTDITVNLSITNAYSGTSKYLRPCQAQTYVLLVGATASGLVVMDVFALVGTGAISIINSSKVSQYFVGVAVSSVFIQTGQSYLCAPNAWSVYSFTDLKVDERIPNLRPRLSGAAVTPGSGDYHDTFYYNVTYIDPDSTKPPLVNISIDGGAPIELDQLDPDDKDYSDGAIFGYNRTGEVLTNLPSPHMYRFTARDGKYMEATGDNITHLGPTVLYNDPPYVLDGASDTHMVMEDSGETIIDLNGIFADDDVLPRSDYLYFQVSQDGEDWYTAIQGDKVNFTVDNMNQKLKVRTNQDKNGKEYVFINVTDSHEYVMDPAFNLTIDVLPVNDRPRFVKVQDSAFEDKAYTLPLDPMEDHWFNITVEAFDIDGDTLEFECDIDHVMGDMDLGESYTFDSSTGDLSFRPNNDHVGQFYTIEYKVRDSILSNTVEVSFNVWNSPDRPHITVPGKQSVEQDKILEFTVSGSDVDMKVDDDEFLTYSIDAGDLLPEAQDDDEYGYTFNEETGRFVLWPDNYMVGVYEVTFGVHDAAGATDSDTVTVTVRNVNDPPTVPQFEATAIERELNITCSITEAATDIDLAESLSGGIVDINERLTYTYDFGDGSPKQIIDDPMQTIPHTYPEAGTYTVTLTVSDRSGETAASTQEVTVERPPATTHTVEFVVKEAETGALLSRATVTLTYGSEEFSDKTDANGQVEFIGIHLNWAYTLSVVLEGYHDHTDDDMTITESGMRIPIQLTPESEPPPVEPDNNATVQAKETESGEFPWWLLALIAALVAVTVIGLAMYSRKKKRKEEEEEAKGQAKEDAEAAAAAARLAASTPPPTPAGMPPPGGATAMSYGAASGGAYAGGAVAGGAAAGAIAGGAAAGALGGAGAGAGAAGGAQTAALPPQGGTYGAQPGPLALPPGPPQAPPPAPPPAPGPPAAPPPAAGGGGMAPPPGPPPTPPQTPPPQTPPPQTSHSPPPPPTPYTPPAPPGPA